MVSEELKAIIDTLKNQGRQTGERHGLFEPATEDQISDFEKNNNLSFLQSSENGCFFLTVVNAFARKCSVLWCCT